MIGYIKNIPEVSIFIEEKMEEFFVNIQSEGVEILSIKITQEVFLDTLKKSNVTGELELIDLPF